MSLAPSAAFDRSAAVYDLLYSAKDYVGESALYASFLGAADHAPEDRLVEWGCGTGKFLALWPRYGWRAVGVDQSLSMLKVAWAKGLHAIRETLPCVGPMALGQFRAAVAPFGVLSYVALDHRLLRDTLELFRRHLLHSGRLVFDVINYAGAVASLIANRVDRFEQDGQTVVRKIAKTFSPDTGIVSAIHEYSITTGGQVVAEWSENHDMRAFTPAELRFALAACGFRLIAMFDPERAAKEPITAEQPIDRGWYTMVVAEAE